MTTIEKITKDCPIFQTADFKNDIVAFNVMRLLMEQPNAQLFSNLTDFAIVMSQEQDTIWAWTITDICGAHRAEMWQFVEYLCLGKHCRVFLKSVLTHPAALDLTPKSSMYAYHCKSCIPTSTAHGEIRPATQNDLYILANMIEQCDNMEKDAAIEKAHRYLDQHTPYLWSDNGDSTVAMAVSKRSAENYTRIGGVYTRPDCRSMGYEKSLIYKITETILAEGRYPMLYASDQSSTSNRYTNMGYIRCGKLAVIEI